MLSRSNNTLKLLLLLSVLFFTPLFFSSGSAMSAAVVDINRADTATMIANWKGIGEKKAKAIVAYRKKNGPFSDISDLANVKGIGEGIIKNNRKFMSVKGGVKTAKKSTTKNTDTKNSNTSKKSKTDKSKAKSTAKKSTTDKSTTKKSTAKKSTTKKSKSKKSTSKKSKSKKPCTDKSSKAGCKKKTN